MNGNSLSDWQWVCNGLNERIRCVAFTGVYTSQGFQPVPVVKSHITSEFIQGLKARLDSLLYYSRWVDPVEPVEIVSDDSEIWERGQGVSGVWPASERLLFDRGGLFEPANVYYGMNRGHEAYKTRLPLTVTRYNTLPPAHAPLGSLGWFLDWVRDTLLKMKKVAEASRGSGTSSGALSSRHQTRCTLYQVYLRWDSSSGKIYEVASGSEVGLASNLAEFYTYARGHYSVYDEGWDSLESHVNLEVVGTDYYLQMNYAQAKCTNPGSVAADLTVYYSAKGSTIAYPANSTSSVIGYSTATFQNVQPGATVQFGFTPQQLVPFEPQTTGSASEELYYLVKVWDFSRYLTYI